MINKIKNMSTKKRVVLILVIIIIDVILVASYLVFKDATALNKFNHEMEEIKKLDISSDNYDREIKSTGNYAVVEKAIKDYLNDYSSNIEDTLSVINDTKLMGILSYDNYTKDGPDFKDSISYLNSEHEKFNKDIDKLISMLEEENIKEYIRTKTKNDYYISLYEDFMLDDIMLDQFNKNKDLLENSKIKVNNVLETSLEVLNFLVTYKDSWVTEDGEIKFQTEDLYNYYNTLISKLKV